MISASALMRNCGYPRVLKNLPPADAKARAARERRDVAAGRGTVFHAAIEAWVRDGVPGVAEDPEIQGWIDLLASQWAPPPNTYVELAWGLTPDGLGVTVVEAEPHVYVQPSGLELLTAGRSDAVWIGYDGVLYVVDWKTGKWPVTPPPANLQINAACIALATDILAGDTMAHTYVPGVYYARDGVFEWGEPVEIGSLAHAEIFGDIRTAALLDNEPRPGDHCGNCWERKVCKSAAVAS